MSAILSALPRRRGKVPRPMPPEKRCLSLFPRNTGQRTRVYAIAFKGGVLKVGRSKNPRSRLADHWDRGAGEVEWVHLFEPMHVETACRAENEFKVAAKGVLESVNDSEWFAGDVSREAVLVMVRKCIAVARAKTQEVFAQRAAAKQRLAAQWQALEKAGLADPHMRLHQSQAPQPAA